MFLYWKLGAVWNPAEGRHPSDLLSHPLGLFFPLSSPPLSASLWAPTAQSQINSRHDSCSRPSFSKSHRRGPEPQVANKHPMVAASKSTEHRIHRLSPSLLIFRHSKPPCDLSYIQYCIPSSSGVVRRSAVFTHDELEQQKWMCGRHTCIDRQAGKPLPPPTADGPWPRSV